MADTNTGPHLAAITKGDFVALLDKLGISLVLSTRPNLLVTLGAIDNELTLSATMIGQTIGLAVEPGRLAVATARTVMIFADVPRLASHHPILPNHYDAYFVPRTIHMTGDCHMHDMIFAGPGIVGANTNFSCIARVDGVSSFTPLWHPNFITQLRPEDRCHLNGFAAEDGELRYVTCLSASDAPAGWRGQPDNRGVLLDAERGVILRSDLCMPHSPRLFAGELYVLNGGEGEVLRVDRSSGADTVLATLPGFTHGLAGQGDYLFVGLSQNRASRKSDPPPVARRHDALVAGVAVIEARTGQILGNIEFSSGVSEVYDVQILPGIRRAGVQNLLSNDRHVAVDTPNAVFWMRRSEDDVHHAHDVVGSGHYQIRVDVI